jgi:hypothetical protein
MPSVFTALRALACGATNAPIVADGGVFIAPRSASSFQREFQIAFDSANAVAVDVMFML